MAAMELDSSLLVQISGTMEEANPALSSASVAVFQTGLLLWYLGMVYTTLGTLFRDDMRLAVEMVVSLSTSLFLYSMVWTLRWYGEGQILFCCFTLLGLFAAFLSIARLVSSAHYGQYTMPLTVYLIGSVLLSALLFVHGPELFFDALSEAASAFLVLAPSVGYQLSASFAPLQYYVCATGFSAFWLVVTVLAVGRHEEWWPLLLATGTLATATQQLLFFFRNSLHTSPLSMIRGSGLAGEESGGAARRLSGSFVLRELRFNQQPSLGVRRDSQLSYQTVSDSEGGYDTVGDSDADEEVHTVGLSPLHSGPVAPLTTSTIVAQSPQSDADDGRLLLPRLSLLSTSSFLQQSESGRDSLGSRRPSVRSGRRRESSLDSFYSYGSCFDDTDDTGDEESDLRRSAKGAKDKDKDKQSRRERRKQRRSQSDDVVVEAV
eukprot:gene2114-1542_t